jgi:hypothetical protein
MAEEKKEEKRNVKIVDWRMKQQGYLTNQRWEVVADAGHNKDDFLKPDYWSHVAIRFNKGDIVEIRCDDESFYGEFYVKSCSKTYAAMKELRWLDLEDTKKIEDEHEEYVYKFRGPLCKHSVIRKSDGNLMVEKLDSKAAALKWIEQYKAKVAA